MVDALSRGRKAEYMKIEIKQAIPSQAPSYTYLYVNDVRLGEYIYGESRLYLYPERWAERQIKKRNVVLNRNIERLEKELAAFKKEKEQINIGGKVEIITPYT